jgi:hypothetical protein
MPHAARYHSLADATSRLFVIEKKTLRLSRATAIRI